MRVLKVPFYKKDERRSTRAALLGMLTGTVLGICSISTWPATSLTWLSATTAVLSWRVVELVLGGSFADRNHWLLGIVYVLLHCLLLSAIIPFAHRLARGRLIRPLFTTYAVEDDDTVIYDSFFVDVLVFIIYGCLLLLWPTLRTIDL